MDSILGAMIPFGILLAIALVGLFKSSAAAARLESSGYGNPDAPRPRDTTLPLSADRP